MNLYETYEEEVLNSIVVLATMAVLFLLTKLIYKWSVKKKLQRFPNESTRSLTLIRRVLNVLWLVLGLIAISYVFANKAEHGKLQNDFRLIAYLGFISVLTIVSASTANFWFKKKIKEKAERNDDTTAFKFLRYVVVTLISFTGILFGLLIFPSLRGVAQTALGGAGVIAIVIGVASQEALSNLIGGIFIIAFKPFKIGDIIKISDSMVGTVTDITLRHTVIRSFENKMIVTPNSVINKEKLINYDLGEPRCCEHVEIGISYDSDVVLAKKIMQEVCQAHPFVIDGRTNLEKKDGQPIVRTALTKLNDSSVTIRAWAWAEDYDHSFRMKCDVLESIKKRFEKEGVEIPYPYHTLVMKNDLEKPTHIEDEADVNKSK
jgi:small-conductance mechanosensitive channel